ncbi:hypothetical protein Hamer_G005174 [Homarus americanus]|uniref:Uncharacterized protein n=1 Tax=Homarus americanus TaxID=6706 RepID=A0A8J5JVA7_HOMAM|nr:hypothetical protein Hamer_G005174 [Homarus americanus]
MVSVCTSVGDGESLGNCITWASPFNTSLALLGVAISSDGVRQTMSPPVHQAGGSKDCHIRQNIVGSGRGIALFWHHLSPRKTWQIAQLLSAKLSPITT